MQTPSPSGSTSRSRTMCSHALIGNFQYLLVLKMVVGVEKSMADQRRPHDCRHTFRQIKAARLIIEMIAPACAGITRRFFSISHCRALCALSAQFFAGASCRRINPLARISHALRGTALSARPPAAAGSKEICALLAEARCAADWFQMSAGEHTSRSGRRTCRIRGNHFFQANRRAGDRLQILILRSLRIAAA